MLAYVTAHSADLLQIASHVVLAASIGAELTENKTDDAIIGKIHAALSFLALNTAKKPWGSGWGCSMSSTSRWSSTRSGGRIAPLASRTNSSRPPLGLLLLAVVLSACATAASIEATWVELKSAAMTSGRKPPNRLPRVSRPHRPAE